MEIIRTQAYARAGLIGNPSDGYNGKTISIVVADYQASIVLYEWPSIEILWAQEDQSCFDDIHDLVKDVRMHGYYGGVRLVKATIKRFVDYCDAAGWTLHDRTFSIRYETNIPRQVGLAGSSAIIIATLRALMRFYGVEIPQQVQPSLALDVEKHELGISAGLQDRVIQVYQGVVAMDFSKDLEQRDPVLDLPYGHYEALDVNDLPPLYLAYSTQVGEPTYVVHNPLRARYEAGDPDVHAAMIRFAELTDLFREAMKQQDIQEMSRLLDENYNTRASICEINPDHAAMVTAARRAGASAKFAGSGGAIIGVCPNQEVFERLQTELEQLDCKVLRPKIVT